MELKMLHAKVRLPALPGNDRIGYKGLVLVIGNERE
jgi:hypothetical protein